MYFNQVLTHMYTVRRHGDVVHMGTTMSLSSACCVSVGSASSEDGGVGTLLGAEVEVWVSVDVVEGILQSRGTAEQRLARHTVQYLIYLHGSVPCGPIHMMIYHPV
jgi:hypothetical protein